MEPRGWLKDQNMNKSYVLYQYHYTFDNQKTYTMPVMVVTPTTLEYIRLRWEDYEFETNPNYTEKNLCQKIVNIQDVYYNAFTFPHVVRLLPR